MDIPVWQGRRKIPEQVRQFGRFDQWCTLPSHWSDLWPLSCRSESGGQVQAACSCAQESTHRAIYSETHITHYILFNYTVSQKTHQLWNGIARNYKDRFWWHFAEMFKRLQNRVCMFQFLRRCAFFINFSSFKLDPYHFELYRFKVGAFYETQCIVFLI